MTEGRILLHIHNGDSSAETAKLSTIPGEHFAFREALIEGPTPSDLGQDEWLKVRAEHLAEGYGEKKEQIERDLAEQQRKLSTLSDHEETVLWFEHDLFCQLHLIYLLDWFGKHDVGNIKLSLICIGEFPGKKDFRGLGELNAVELASLLPGRQPVTQQHIKLATSAWQSYCATEPTEVQALLQTNTSVLPFLAAALRAHLARFPSTENGLGSIENTALRLIDSGKLSSVDLFQAFCDALPIYGLGDSQLWLALKRLSHVSEPLLLSKSGKRLEGNLEPDQLRDLGFEITEAGHSVLAGKTDFVTLNGIDQWLGGVHLSNQNVWRWNDRSGSLEFHE